jgi:hypothetical protein
LTETGSIANKTCCTNSSGEAATVVYEDCNDNTRAERKCTGMGEGVIRESLREERSVSRRQNRPQRHRQGTDLRKKTDVCVCSEIEQ